jgi:hypothetical protein
MALNHSKLNTSVQMYYAQCGGNNRGKMDKNGGGRVEDRGEPGMVASVQTGYMDQMTRDRI